MHSSSCWTWIICSCVCLLNPCSWERGVCHAHLHLLSVWHSAWFLSWTEWPIFWLINNGSQATKLECDLFCEVIILHPTSPSWVLPEQSVHPIKRRTRWAVHPWASCWPGRPRRAGHHELETTPIWPRTTTLLITVHIHWNLLKMKQYKVHLKMVVKLNRADLRHNVLLHLRI